MPSFAHIATLNWLWLLPLAAFALWLYMQWQKNTLNRLADKPLQDVVLPNFVSNRSIFYGIYICAAVVLLIFALANLQAGKKPRKAMRAGLDLVVAIDVSKSMEAQDLKPSRMAQAKHFAEQLIKALPQDRVGLVVFAGNAYIQLPLTNDLQAATMFVNTINTDIAPTQGTSVTDAINLSMNLLYPQTKATPTSSSAKVIVILSDGENHEEGAEKAALEAKNNGAIIYSVGVGTTQGSAIPIMQNGAATLQKDENGEVVISKLNQSILQQISAKTNGKYFYLAGDRDAAKHLVDELSKLKRGEKEVKVFDEYESYFQVFAALALLLLLIEPVSQILNNRTKKIAA